MLLVTAYSTYEVDQEQHLVRRVTGLNPPSKFIGEDGVWREYADTLVSLDGGLWFWNSEGRGFVTSPVMRIVRTQPEREGTCAE